MVTGAPEANQPTRPFLFPCCVPLASAPFVRLAVVVAAAASAVAAASAAAAAVAGLAFVAAAVVVVVVAAAAAFFEPPALSADLEVPIFDYGLATFLGTFFPGLVLQARDWRVLFSRAFSSHGGFVFFIIFCGCANLWGAPQLSCGRSPVGRSPIVLRARGAPACVVGAHLHKLFCRRAHWRSMRCFPIVSRACSLMGCSPICFLQATGYSALYEVLSPALPDCFAGVLAHGSASLLVFCSACGQARL